MESRTKVTRISITGQAEGTIGVALGYGRGEGDLSVGKAAFQSDEYGSHLTDENGSLIPVGGNGFKLSSFNDGVISFSGPVEVTATDDVH